jgi:hypothetical protein
MNGSRCEFCFEYFSDNIKLNLHKVLKRASISDPCVVCGKVIPACVSRKRHLESHPMCRVCKVHFKSEDLLSMHKIIHHSSSIPPELLVSTRSDVFICYLCELDFNDASLARIHVNSMHFLLKQIMTSL